MRIPHAREAPAADGEETRRSAAPGAAPSRTPSGTAEALDRLAAHGDADAWRVVAEQHGPAMQRLALAILGDAELAADACQDALIRVRAGARSFRPQPADPEGSARGWLMRVAANTAISHHRRRQTRRTRERALGEQAAHAPEEPERDPAARAALRRALDGLPERHRLPLVLHYLSGLPHADLATALGCSIGTSRVRLHRALTLLRERLSRAGVALGALALAELLAAEELPLKPPDPAWLALPATTPAGAALAPWILGCSAVAAALVAAVLLPSGEAGGSLPPPLLPAAVATSIIPSAPAAPPPADIPAPAPTTIAHAELAALVASRGGTIVDVCGSDWFRNGHIPGAIDFERHRGDLAAVLPPGRDAAIVVYCRDARCPYWETAATELRAMGYGDVRRYADGLAGWRRAGGAIERTTR